MAALMCVVIILLITDNATDLFNGKLATKLPNKKHYSGFGLPPTVVT